MAQNMAGVAVFILGLVFELKVVAGLCSKLEVVNILHSERKHFQDITLAIFWFIILRMQPMCEGWFTAFPI